MKKSLLLQFANHRRAMFAPVFLGHPSVLSQRFHVSHFAERTGQAAGPTPYCCDGLPFGIVRFGFIEQGASACGWLWFAMPPPREDAEFHAALFANEVRLLRKQFLDRHVEQLGKEFDLLA